jgi:DMSO/TMAO reductase YedYZ heme-binding membrane subunit
MRPAAPAIGLPPGGSTNQLIRPATSIPRPPARGGTVYRGLPEIVKIVGWIVLAVAFGFIVGSTAPTAFSRIAAVLQVQPGLLAWYCVRALGILAYLVLAASILYGLLLSTKILDVIAHRPVSFALHKDLAIVALVLGTLHGLLLTFDQSFNFTLTAILVPFQSPYAPVAVGIGQLTLYASAVVTASFYVRRRIGQKAWRLLHYITFLVFIGSSVHGITSGSDSGTPWAFWMYLLAVTATIFLTTYRIVVAVAIRADEFDVARITGTGTLPASRGPLDRPGARGGYPWPT